MGKRKPKDAQLVADADEPNDEFPLLTESASLSGSGSGSGAPLPAITSASSTALAEESLLRMRKSVHEAQQVSQNISGETELDEKKLKRLPNLLVHDGQQPGKPWRWRILVYCTALLSFFTRFYCLHVPNQVVFDEVHFGKFASYYLRQTYYFDVHPPLGRLLLALVGYLIGYSGHYNFTNIGEDYTENKVPYIGLRAWPAFCGAMVAPLVVELLRELGFSMWAAMVAGVLIVFDNALIAQSRLILLDSMLMLFMTMTLLSYVKFTKQRRHPFSAEWWKSLFLCGVSLGLVMGIKMVGLFTVATIGISVLFDLWYYLDYRKTTVRQFIRHFSARALCLILVPFAFYLLWFYIHFAVLTHTGPGDVFMSTVFQSTLKGNKMSENAKAICYGANITIKHYETSSYLHSHREHYPLRYADGRISSQGQQVTAYPHKDINNLWRILPANATSPDDYAKYLDPDNEPIVVKNDDVVILQHVSTATNLLTHDVASPLTPTNQEFTTVNPGDRYNETLFKVQFDYGREGELFKTLGVNFRLIHVLTNVAMHTHKAPLPEWGFKQQEVNGNKKSKEPSNKWLVEDVTNINPTNVPDSFNFKIDPPPFLSKFIELQSRMISQNAALTKPHPYQAPPSHWPFLMRGISFWQNKDDKQIYLIGNPIGWWIALTCVGVYAVGWILEAILRRRGAGILDPATTKQFHYSAGFLFIAYCLHYLPFFLMGRSLFLHHYLPASIISFALAGAVYDFILHTLFPHWEHSTSHRLGATLMTLMVVTVLVGTFWVFEPITYGSTGLTKEELMKRKWLESWDFQYVG